MGAGINSKVRAQGMGLRRGLVFDGMQGGEGSIWLASTGLCDSSHQGSCAAWS